MSMNLAGVSVAFVCASLLMLAASVVIDIRVADGRTRMEPARSMLMMRPQNAAILLLTYAAIAFSQDLALEWLASVAVLVCFASSLLRRGASITLARRESKDQDGGNGEESPSMVAGHMTQLFLDILIYVSALDLVLLFGMALFEKVIPYYLGLAIG